MLSGNKVSSFDAVAVVDMEEAGHFHSGNFFFDSIFGFSQNIEHSYQIEFVIFCCSARGVRVEYYSIEAFHVFGLADVL